MKKRVLAALLAVCMIAGTCVLYASAATYAKKDAKLECPGDKISAAESYTLSGSDIQAFDTASDQNYKVSVKDKPEVSASESQVTAENITGILDFNPSISVSDLKKYFTIKGTYETDPNDTAKFIAKNVEISVKPDYKKMLSIKQDITKDTGLNSDDYEVKDRITINGKNESPTYTQNSIPDIAKIDKLQNLTVGLRFYGDSSYANLNANEIALIKAVVDRGNNNGPSSVSVDPNTFTLGPSDYITYANTIYDLSLKDAVYLYTSLKKESEGKYYKFYAWVDGNGKILSRPETLPKDAVQDGKQNSINPTFGIKVSPDQGAIYAAYVEIANRVMIEYTKEGEGDFRGYSDDREITKIGGAAEGKNIVSVMEGRDVKFTFVPAEGWEVGKVIVDGTNVASFASINFSEKTNLVETLKTIIAATYKDELNGQQKSGSYTFKNIKPLVTNSNDPHTIKVVFVKAKILETPSGKELPTIEAEGLTLATGAAAENNTAAAAAAVVAVGGDGSVTTLPAEPGAAAAGAAVGGVVNPATGSGSAIAVFAVLSVAAGAAFVTAKKKED